MRYKRKNLITMNKNLINYFLPMFLILSVVSCKDEKSNDIGKVTKIKTAMVKEQQLNQPVRTSGQVASEKEVMLSFKTGGIIKNVFVDEGSTVKKGQTIAKLNLSEIKAHFSKAELALEKAQRDFRRAKNLYEDSVVTLEQFQDAKTQLKIRENEMEIARFNLEHSVIKSPGYGKIFRVLAEPGEITAAGHPVVVFGSTNNNWVVKVNVTSKDYVKLQTGDSAHVSIDAWPTEKFKAMAIEISNAADPYTGTYKVELRINDKGKKMASGMIAKVKIFPSEGKKYLTVPIDALVEADEYTGFVYVIENKKHIKKRIRIKGIFDETVAVEGLEKGMKVVTDGAMYLENDSKIEIVK